MVQGTELQNFCSLFLTEGATYIVRAAITLGIGPRSCFLAIIPAIYWLDNCYFYLLYLYTRQQMNKHKDQVTHLQAQLFPLSASRLLQMMQPLPVMNGENGKMR